MALCLNVFALPNEHILFLKEYPLVVDDYIYGESPEIEVKKPKFRSFFAKFTKEKSQCLPNNWPTSEVKMIGPLANHRNIELYHYILNGTNKSVEGSGSLFQTWFDLNQHSAIKMDNSNGNYAFNSEQLPDLFTLLNGLNDKVITKRFDEWLSINDVSDKPNELVYKEVIDGCVSFKEGVAEAVEKGLGLMWTAS